MPGDPNKPTPDPTVLTTEQLERAIENLKQLLHAEVAGMEAKIHEELKSVRTQFSLIERQRVEQKADTEKAVQAALSAAKEAVKEQTAASDKSITKSETAMTEQLKQLTATFTTAIGGVSEAQNDMKERLGKIESRKEGGEEARHQQGATRGEMWTVAGLILSAIAVIAAIVIATLPA